MFKKWKDRLTGGGHQHTNPGIDTLVNMGFHRDQAHEALQATGGNVEQAAELLLTSNSTSNTTTTTTSTSSHHTSSYNQPSYNNITEDEQLRLALEASLQTEEARQYNDAFMASSAARPRPTNMSKAGQAAAERASKAKGRYGANGISTKKPTRKTTTTVTTTTRIKMTTTKITTTKSNPPPKDPNAVKTFGNKVVVNHHHPNVTVPTQMKDKSKEEQILRCAERVAPYAAAVDTLLIALKAIRDDPANPKYRKVDKTTAGYQKVLHDVPGAEQLLLAMNFQKRGSTELIMDRSQVDMALLYLGISALQKAQETTEYKESKESIAFFKEMKKVQQLSSQEETLKRANFLSKCPSEPTSNGALIQCQLDDSTIIRRKFDGDDILLDIIHWIGSHGSVIPEHIASRKWCLVDMNRYPVSPIDTSSLQQKTLQYIGCWPSGRLEIRPSPLDWKNNSMEDMVGSSRGLGAATSTML